MPNSLVPTANPGLPSCRALIAKVLPAAAIGLGAITAPAIAAAALGADPVFAAIERYKSAQEAENTAFTNLWAAEADCGSPYVDIQIGKSSFRVRNEDDLIRAIDRCYPAKIKKAAGASKIPLDEEFDSILSEHYEPGYSFAKFDSECKAAMAKLEAHMQSYNILAKAHDLEGKEARNKEASHVACEAERSVFGVRPASDEGSAALLLHMANYLAEGGDPEPALAALVSTAQRLDPNAAKRIPYSIDLTNALAEI